MMAETDQFKHGDVDCALRELGKYSHSSRTDLAKGKMTNHDAMAVLFARLGPMTRGDATRLLRAWRGSCQKFAWMFNSSMYGGYGFVGRDVMSRGNLMAYERGSTWTVSRGDGGAYPAWYTKYFTRRTYWHRARTGVYAPTVECMKRVQELGLA